jgi:dolichyl-phosphate-mannose--protein O-mannosyl transferase
LGSTALWWISILSVAWLACRTIMSLSSRRHVGESLRRE